MAQMNGFPTLELDYPQSVGVFDKYAEAQHAVDYLADQNFPVQHIAIVGTDLKMVERVTGRRTWGSVVAKSIQNGLTTGLIVGILLGFFAPEGQLWQMVLIALGVSLGMSILFNALGYAVTGGKRDFNSVAQTVPTHFEVLCEHKSAAQARELLGKRPGANRLQF